MIFLLQLVKKKHFFYKAKIFYFLKKIYGIGFVRSRRLTLLFGVNKYFNVRVNKVSSNNSFFIRVQRRLFKSKFLVDLNLKQRRRYRLILLQNYKTYRGIRFYYGLPVRGQRTHTNASTPKKFLFIAQSGKKNNRKKNNKTIRRF